MATGEKCSLSLAESTGISKCTCYQEAHPEYYVEARTVEDIQCNLRFAKKHNVPVTINNTAHDYKVVASHLTRSESGRN